MQRHPFPAVAGLIEELHRFATDHRRPLQPLVDLIERLHVQFPRHSRSPTMSQAARRG